MCQSLSFNKLASLGSTVLLKKRLWHRCLPANFAKSLRTEQQLRVTASVDLLLSTVSVDLIYVEICDLCDYSDRTLLFMKNYYK